MVKDGVESIDDWILNQWPKNDSSGFGTNRESIEYSMIIERSEMESMCRSNDGITSAWLSV